MINKRLAKSRGLTDLRIEEIEKVAKQLDDFIENPQQYVKYPTTVQPHIKHLEFELQYLWEFPKDETCHRYWYRVKWCTCPIIDNEELFAISQKIINMDCPYHGTNKAESWMDERFHDED